MEKETGTGPLSSEPRDRELESGTTSLSLENDVAIGLVGERAQEIDPAVEARALRKIDLFLIPAMIVGELPGIYTHFKTNNQQVTDLSITTKRS
jgi:hypothetical protein